MNPVIEWMIDVWLYVLAGIAGGIVCYFICKRKEMSMQKQLTCFFILALVFHVLEEWVYPAGLHYIHNLSMNSPDPNCYPMNQFSDMITNFVAVIIALGVLWKFSENAIAGFTLAFFCIAEAVAHIRLSIIAILNFHDAGMNIPYSPGLVTVIFGFLIVSVFLLRDLKKRKEVKGKSIFYAVLCLLAVMALLVLIPENGLKDMETPYRFPTAGYYQKYLE